MQNRVASNIIWNLLERWGAQGVTFIVSIILARLLEPSMYGTISLVTVFTAILSVFIDSGFGSALVQKKNTDDLDFSTVFYFNVTICLILYIAMFVAAPYIAMFYNMPELTSIVRVLSLSLILSGVKNILVSIVQRNLQYRMFFFATLSGTIGAAIIGISMAYLGFGVWALVAQSLFNTAVDTIILWVIVKWKPKKIFSFSRLKVLFSFGWKILAVTLINKVYENIRQLIIGKMYSTKDLAYYTKASGWPNLLFVNISGAVDSVMFPVMSRAQDSISEITRIMGRTIRLNSYVVFPMLAGLSLCAETAVSLVLTDKWLPCVPYMRIFCLTYAFNVMGNTNLNMVRSLGKSDVFMKIEIIKKTIGILALLFTMRYGVMAIAYSLIFVSFMEQLINSCTVYKLTGYSFVRQIRDVSTAILCTMVMAFFVILIGTVPITSKICLLTLQIAVGIISYLLVSYLFHVEAFETLLSWAKSRKKVK